MKACIFDLDGVIVDTAKYHYLAWKRLAGELGVVLTERVNEQLKGISRIESLNVILALGNLSMSDPEKEKLAERKNEWFVEYINQMKKDEVFPGVLNLIDQLRSNGIRVALASSSRNAKSVLRLLHLEDVFDTVVDGNMIRNTKPHPEIFLRTAELLSTPPSDCVVIEDAQAGIEAAKSAGMKCVGIGNPVNLMKADFVAEKIFDLDYQNLKEL